MVWVVPVPGWLAGWCRETLHKEMRVVDKFRNKGEEERVLQKFSDIEAKKPHTFLYDIGRSKVRRDGGGRHRSQEGVPAALRSRWSPSLS